MHVHVFDKGAFSLGIAGREALNAEFKEYAIDPRVSRGRIRPMRLPYSLNGLVSRIVLPFSKKEAERFDPLTAAQTLPGSLKG
jgi:DNA primase catalytic subunit